MNTAKTNYRSLTIQVSTNPNPIKSYTVKKRKQIRIPTEPIKLKSDIQLAKDYLLNKPERYSINKTRDYALFVLMINIAKRVGDVLNLKVKDIFNLNGTYKKSFIIITSKRQKQEEIFITPVIKEALDLYFKQNPQILEDRDNGLFPTRESNGKSMSYETAWRIYKKIESEINKTKEENEKIHIATHTARKTKAFQYVNNHKDDQYSIAKVSKALGHNDIKTTMCYLGLDRKELSDFYADEL